MTGSTGRSDSTIRGRPDEGSLDRLATAPDGSVWAGYEGVARFDPGSNRWQLFSTADGLIDMRVTDIEVRE